jgi:hypothetical protein
MSLFELGRGKFLTAGEHFSVGQWTFVAPKWRRSKKNSMEQTAFDHLENGPFLTHLRQNPTFYPTLWVKRRLPLNRTAPSVWEVLYFGEVANARLQT